MQTDADGLFWDDNVVDLYKWKAHNGTGSLGKYTITKVYTSHTFSDSGNKYDSAWSNAGTMNNGYFEESAALKTYMATQTAWTIEAWIKVPALASGVLFDALFCRGINNIMDFGYSRSNSNYTNTVLCRYYSGTDTNSWTYPTVDWHHFSVGWDGSKARFWLDGNLLATKNSTTNQWTASSPALRFGGNELDASAALKGYMDRMIISNVDRAGAETSPLTITGRAGIKYGCILGGSPKIISGGRL